MPHTRKDIKCRQLRKLYLDDKLSLIKIGKKLGFSARTIQIKCGECKIKLRKPGIIPPKISDSKIKSLYIKKRMSSRKIAKIYKCAYSYIDSRIKQLKIPRRNLSTSHITTKRNDFSGDLKEKSYLIGFRIGDLRVRKMYKNSETILVDCASTKPKQIKLIKNLFKKYGRVWISKPKQNNKVQIECGLNNSFTFLLEKFDTFPEWTLKNQNLSLSILAGFIEAEGSFYVGKDNQGGFSVGNYNKAILTQTSNLLNKNGLRSRLFLGVKKGYTGRDGYVHSADYWILSISRKKDLYNFIKKILPFLRHEDKIKSANKVLKNITERNIKYGFIGM